MRKLEGRVAIVTGGTSGMGRGIAEIFAQEGAAVVVGGRDGQRGQIVVDGIRSAGGKAELVTGDISRFEVNEALVRRARDAFGRVDILVPNVGILGVGSITEVPLETWHATVNTNLNGVFYLLRAGIPELQRSGGGTIVVNGSIAAWQEFPNHAAYCATKGALVSLVKQVALDYAPSIRANILCPGPVDTPLLWDSAKAFPNSKTVVQELVEQKIRLKRLGTPGDIAKAALFLASSDSSWVTGTSLVVDGGRMLG